MLQLVPANGSAADMSRDKLWPAVRNGDVATGHADNGVGVESENATRRERLLIERTGAPHVHRRKRQQAAGANVAERQLASVRGRNDTTAV